MKTISIDLHKLEMEVRENNKKIGNIRYDSRYYSWKDLLEGAPQYIKQYSKNPSPIWNDYKVKMIFKIDKETKEFVGVVKNP